MNALLNPNLFRRFLARTIDYFWWSIVLNVCNMVLFPNQDGDGAVSFLLGGFFSFFIVEAFMMHKFKTTPGKKMFGITLNPEPSSFYENLKRSFLANALGMGFGFALIGVLTWPILILYYNKKGQTPWDNNKRDVVVADLSFKRVFMALLMVVIVSQLMAFIQLSLQPPSIVSNEPKTLIDSPHEEKKLDKVESIFYAQPISKNLQPFVEGCMKSAAMYAKYKKVEIDYEELASYCTEGGQRIVPVTGSAHLLKTACGYGITYTVKKEKGELADRPSTEEEKFYLEFCEDADVK